MSSGHTLRGSFRKPAPNAVKVGRPSAAERLEVTLVLRRKHSAPDPDDLDQHLSHAELTALHGADDADIEAVEAFTSARHFSIAHTHPGARTVTLSGPFGALAAAFGADVELQRVGDKTYRGRRGNLYLPAELANRVIAVLGFDSHPVAHTNFKLRPKQSGAVSYSPPQVAQLYNFPKNSTGSNQTIALIELGGGYQSADLQSYWRSLGLGGVAVTAIGVNGAGNEPTGDPNGPDGEVVLDIEIAGAVAPNAKLAVYFGSNTDQGFLNAINAAIHDPVRKPSVLSISWGGSEDQWTRQSLDAFDQTLRDAALLGISVFCAAGDNGSSDGESDGAPHVDFPASSCWAIACGGTSLRVDATGALSETVWNDDPAYSATGGGVSTFFALPAWQRQAGVPASIVRPKFAGRGVPDVAGCADPDTGYEIYVDGAGGVVGGTSAVAPLWAALAARLNERLGRRVGFLNSLGYRILFQRSAFNDILSGGNGAYAAKAGWDPCTGLGSPNGQAILDVLSGEFQKHDDA